MGMNCPRCSAELADVVPRSRLNEEAQKVADAKAAAEQARAEAQEQVRAAQAAAEGARAELGSWQAKESAWSEERTILRTGITDQEGIDAARYFFSRLPEGQRPEGGMQAWLESRDTLPAGVRAYLPSQPTATAPTAPSTGAAPTASLPSSAAPTGAPPAPAAPPAPPSNAGVVPTSGARAGQFDANAILRAARDGSYRSKRSAILQSVGIPVPSASE